MREVAGFELTFDAFMITKLNVEMTLRKQAGLRGTGDDIIDLREYSICTEFEMSHGLVRNIRQLQPHVLRALERIVD